MAGIEDYGFVRVAAACPAIRLADPKFNAQACIELLKQAEEQGVHIVCFPEMCLTGYTCGDLFHQKALIDSALEGLFEIVAFCKSGGYKGAAVIGLPLLVQDGIFNVAAVIAEGGIQGIVPKAYLPNYKEFYEARYFASADQSISRTWWCRGDMCEFGLNQVFYCASHDFSFGIEICEDLWGPIPPSSRLALQGATILLNLSASNETIGKAAYRRELVKGQSARCIAGYIYSGCGTGESTGDIVFGGHCLIGENGTLLAESKRFEGKSNLTVADIDVRRLEFERRQTTSFRHAPAIEGRREAPGPLNFDMPYRNLTDLLRPVEAHPFVPGSSFTLKDRCEEIFNIQVAGLSQRLEHIGQLYPSIGVSGGLDSTLALLVLCKTLDNLGWNRDRIRALTMPGFGTGTRTKTNAIALMGSLGVDYREIDIRPLALAEMKALGHAPFGIPLAELTIEKLNELLADLPPEKRNDLSFENVQARLRTSLLMNTGFVIGTGDMSELALGWCTYNADHMSMYNVNVGVPKTLVKFLVTWAAENEFAGEARRILLDIADTPISPELLPPGRDGQSQSTEEAVGPYELVDFFLYHFLRYGTPPKKILFLASHAKFDKPYTSDELKHWLRLFLKRFFANQFKRSCMPDGPKVGSVSLSPRGDWRMPSDAQATAWLADLD